LETVSGPASVEWRLGLTLPQVSETLWDTARSSKQQGYVGNLILISCSPHLLLLTMIRLPTAPHRLAEAYRPIGEIALLRRQRWLGAIM
jgi:hypothetical protein